MQHPLNVFEITFTLIVKSLLETLVYLGKHLKKNVVEMVSIDGLFVKYEIHHHFFYVCKKINFCVYKKKGSVIKSEDCINQTKNIPHVSDPRCARIANLDSQSQFIVEISRDQTKQPKR